MASDNVMQSQQMLKDDDDSNALPPVISVNLREKLNAEQVSMDGLTCITDYNKKKSAVQESKAKILKPPAKPLYDLEIICYPSELNFEIEDVVIVRRLRIWNPLPRSIYFHCCGLWDETCRLGAHWRIYPRTRFLLVSGLPVEIYIKATPRGSSPVRRATIGLQLAAAHKGDLVVGFFVVPIRVTFFNYLPALIQRSDPLLLE